VQQDTNRLDALRSEVAQAHEKIATLEKMLDMAFAAMETSNDQIVELNQRIAQTSNALQQTNVTASSAMATAESTADGLAELETQLAGREK
jgi:predicted  nucleic acid-binding Zn-ribbon protein